MAFYVTKTRKKIQSLKGVKNVSYILNIYQKWDISITFIGTHLLCSLFQVQKTHIQLKLSLKLNEMDLICGNHLMALFACYLFKS